MPWVLSCSHGLDDAEPSEGLGEDLSVETNGSAEMGAGKGKAWSLFSTHPPRISWSHPKPILIAR